MANNNAQQSGTGAQTTTNLSTTTVWGSSTGVGATVSVSSGGGGGGSSGGGGGDSSGGGGGGPTASASEGLTFGSGFKDTEGTTIKTSFQNSTAVSSQLVTTASVTLNDVDSTQGGCKPNPCHNPLPNQPSVNVYFDKIFGSFMFQDPGAPPDYTRVRVPICCRQLINSLARQEVKHPRFSDVPPSDPASGAIGLLARIHMLPGFADDTFHPSEPFTRAQLATAMATALPLPSAGGSTAFSDVPSNDPAAAAIASAAKAQLIVTPSATKFGSTEAVTRQDLAVSLARAFKLKPQTASFTDSSQIASYAKDAVPTVAAMGYLPAYPGGAFQPTTTLTREQAAEALFLAVRDYSAQGSPK